MEINNIQMNGKAHTNLNLVFIKHSFIFYYHVFIFFFLHIHIQYGFGSNESHGERHHIKCDEFLACTCLQTFLYIIHIPVIIIYIILYSSAGCILGEHIFHMFERILELEIGESFLWGRW